MNKLNKVKARQNNASHNPRKQRRFCDSLGLYGLLCLGFFGSFIALLEYGVRS
ncbi:hypothetical protein [Cerasicoccus frondis]|uniref:hypothetical protein n=1 Tax=Cerasicoccus frondis TaxID=490090 RepID=UPI00285280ED|nr:hypothetical protein [Cerasicoccus frondis]